MPIKTVEIWYPDEGIWKEGTNLPEVRYGAGMIILDGMPSILGGSDKLRAKNNVWAFNYYHSIRHWIEGIKKLKVTRTFAGYVAVPETLYDRC